MPGRASGRARSRVLVVDDNVNLAENIAEFLSLQGYESVIASTGAEALSNVVPAGFDLIVTDYRLPDTNGASVVRTLRQMGLHARAIVISAYTDDQTIADARSAGAEFMAKPMDFHVLGRMIQGSARPTGTA